MSVLAISAAGFGITRSSQQLAILEKPQRMNGASSIKQD